MQKLLDKWHLFQSNKKMTKLWKEYKKAAKLGDKLLKSQKLNSFLTQFKQVALDYIEKQKTNPKLEKLFTEIADLLSILIEQISVFDEQTVQTKEPAIRTYFRNVLQSVELILKDPAYREQLQSSTVLLTQLVTMLNNIADDEAKIILIKLLGILGKSLENKIIIGQNEGFRKLVGLMLEQNEDLLKGIIDTFKQILDITPEKDLDYLMNETKIPAIGDLGSISPEEIRSLIDVAQLDCPSETGGRASAKVLIETAKPEPRPSYELLKRMSMEIKTGDATESVAGRTSSGAEEKKQRITCVTLFKNYGDKAGHPFEESKGDSVAEAMVIQGTLNTVCDILLTTRKELQIDLMLIIAKLLVKSAYNQAEFKKIEGYFVLAVMLNQKRDCTDEGERRYLKACMQVLKKIIFNDDEQKVIVNQEAFKVLLSLISTSPQVVTISEAVILLNEILAANVRNCLIFLKMAGFVDLHVLLLRLLFPEAEYDRVATSAEFAGKNGLTKLIALYRFKYVRHEETVTDPASKSPITTISESFSSFPIAEKERVELFVQVDVLLMSLCATVSPLHILPGASIYAHLVSCPQLPAQFAKCLLDRLEVMINDKLTKTSLPDYEQIYSADLEQVLRHLSFAMTQQLRAPGGNAELGCGNLLEVYHRYLLFTAGLQHYARPEETTAQLEILRNGTERPKNNVYETLEKVPEILNFLYSLLSSSFLNNPYYTEIVYSVLECIISSALPCVPVVKFVSGLLSMDAKTRLRYQDLTLLAEVCASSALSEAVTELKTGEKKAAPFENLFKSENPDARLSCLFNLYVLCRHSEKNRLLLEVQTKPLEFIPSFGFLGLAEVQQLFFLEVMRELIHGQDAETAAVDYCVLIGGGMDRKDVDLLVNIRNEVRSPYKSITTTSISNPAPNTINGHVLLANLHNLFLLLIMNSAPSIQSKILAEVIEDLGGSLELCNSWMHLEALDPLMEVYHCLSDSENPLRGQYLRLISRILGRGVSLSNSALFRTLIESSKEFQQAVLGIAEEEDLPLAFHISGEESSATGYICTLPLKYFPRERVGFSITFWVKFSAISPSSMSLFELIGEKQAAVVMSCKYSISGSASRASSGSQTKGEGGDAVGTGGSARGESLKYAVVVEAEGNSGRIELEAPLLEANKLTHVAIQYSKSSHCGYINGKQIYCSKTGAQNPYPMAFAKGLRLKVSSQPKSLSTVTLYEGAIDSKSVMNLWLRGPIGEYTSTQKELGIDLPRLYRFPKPIKDKKHELVLKKLIVGAGEEGQFRCPIYPLTVGYKDFQPEYLGKIKYPPDSEFISQNTKGAKGADYEVCGPIKVVLSHTVTLKEYLSTPEFAKMIVEKLYGPIDSAEFATLLQIFELLILRNDKYVATLQKEASLADTFVRLSSHRRGSSADWNADQQTIFSVLFDLLCSQRGMLHELNVFSKPRLLAVPIIHPSRFEYFKAIKLLAVMSERSQCETILNMLSNLLVRQENAEKLAGEGLLTMLLHLLGRAHERTRNSDNSFMYEKLLEVLQLFFHWHHILDWELLFSFFLLLNSKEDGRAQEVLVDLLSMLSVYMLVGGNRVALAEKFAGMNGLRLIHKLAGARNITVVEHTIKLLSALLLANPKIKQMVVKMKGFDILAHRLLEKTPTFSLLQTLLDFAVGNFNVEALYPQNNSYVSTVINRSPIASEVIANQTGTKTKTSAGGIMNVEVLETLFSALSRTKELHYRINMLRQLQNFFANEQDAQKALDAGIFVWIVEYFKCLEVEQQNVAGEDMAAESLKKIAKMSFKMLCCILIAELSKSPKHSKVAKILQSIPSVDHIQGLVLDQLFKAYCKPGALKTEAGNLIKNLSGLLAGLPSVLTITDDTRFKIVRVVNVIASKNTMEIRSLMKASGLFELRDSFLLELLNSEVHTTDSMQLLQQINLEALAGGAKFRESRTIEALVAQIIETKDFALRQGMLETFQKQVCRCPENSKYLGKIVEDVTLASILSSKTLQELDTYLEEKKGKALEKVLKVANSQKTERMKQQLRNAQDRSTRRNKTFSDISKEKAAIQSVLADHETQELKYVAASGPQVALQKLEELQTSCRATSDLPIV